MQSDFAAHPSYRSFDQQPLEMAHEDTHLVEGCHDYWRKRLLAFIQAMFVLLLILVAMNFFMGLMSGHFSLVPFFPLLLLWVVLYVGHIGAHHGRASFLHAYFILNVLIICFIAVTFVLFPAVLGTVICTLDGGYGSGCSFDEAKSIAHVTFIGILFAFIPCLPAAMGAIYALRARNELLMAQLRASVEAELGVVLDRSIGDAERQGLLPGQGVSYQQQQQPLTAPPPRYYYSCDYRPVAYAPNPPQFSSTAGPQSPTPLHFPSPPMGGYYYHYPPPPARGVPGVPTAPAPSAAPVSASVPPQQQQQQQSDDKARP
jgi:hypothetical protein